MDTHTMAVMLGTLEAALKSAIEELVRQNETQTRTPHNRTPDVTLARWMGYVQDSRDGNMPGTCGPQKPPAAA